MSAHPIGVWTPWGEVLCWACHEVLAQKNRHEPALDGDAHKGVCCRCHADVVMDDAEVAQLSRVKRLWDKAGKIKSHLEQTGGMCAAFVVSDGDETPRVVVGADMICSYASESAMYEAEPLVAVEAEGWDDAAIVAEVSRQYAEMPSQVVS